MVPSPHEPATCHRMGWFNMRVANVSAVGFGQRVLKLEEFYTAMTEEEIRERLGVGCLAEVWFILAFPNAWVYNVQQLQYDTRQVS